MAFRIRDIMSVMKISQILRLAGLEVRVMARPIEIRREVRSKRDIYRLRGCTLTVNSKSSCALYTNL